jgi:HemY protein
VKIGLLLVLTLALGALSANYLLADNGYVLINFRGYAIEMSVPVLAFLLIVVYLVVRAGVRMWHAPRQLGEMAARRRVRKAGDRIVRGYIEMGEGNFARGEKLLTKGVRNSETPLLNYLAAARAAQAQGDQGRRDNWLKMAYDQEPRAAATVLLTQAELQLANEEVEQARATLNKVLEMTPHNQQALRLKAELCLAKNDWAELQALLPKLSKNNQIPAELLNSWYVRTWCALLNAADNDPERVQKLWKQLPRHLRDNALVMSARIKALIAEGQMDEAETVIRKALNQEWSEELIRLYADLEVADQAKLLRRAEGWLQTRSEDAALLLAAGRLCVRNELWGKARSYFESCIAIRPSPEAWHELGQLLIRMDEADAASVAFQKGLTLSYGGADVPRITAGMADD